MSAAAFAVGLALGLVAGVAVLGLSWAVFVTVWEGRRVRRGLKHAPGCPCVECEVRRRAVRP